MPKIPTDLEILGKSRGTPWCDNFLHSNDKIFDDEVIHIGRV